MSSGEESREEELTIVNLENVKRISETFKPRRGAGKDKRGLITKCMVKEVWKDRLSPRFYSRLMSVMFPEESNEVSFLSFYTIYKNLAEPDTEVMFRALTIYHIATIHEPPFNYEQANEYPNASYKAIKDYVCDVITSYLHAIIQFNMKEACAWLDLRASNTLIDGNLVASYMLKDLETHRNEVSIGSLEIWLEKNEMYYTVSEQLYLYLFGVKSYCEVKPLLPFPVIQTGRATKTLLALPDVLLLNSKLPRRSQRWTLAYMLDSRSQNWESLKNAIYGKSQTIIVIQDANGDIFGMYGSQKWFPCKGFFGNNECFLFTLKPDVNIYEGSGRDNNFQLFSESGIGLGGTKTDPGLFISWSLRVGTTATNCVTFNKFWPVSRDLVFDIRILELWVVKEVFMKRRTVPNRDFLSTVVMWNKIGKTTCKEDDMKSNRRDCWDPDESDQPLRNDPASPIELLESDDSVRPRNQPDRNPREINMDEELLKAIRNRLEGGLPFQRSFGSTNETRLQRINEEPQVSAQPLLIKPVTTRELPKQLYRGQGDDRMITELKTQGTSMSRVNVGPHPEQHEIFTLQYNAANESQNRSTRIQLKGEDQHLPLLQDRIYQQNTSENFYQPSPQSLQRQRPSTSSAHHNNERYQLLQPNSQNSHSLNITVDPQDRYGQPTHPNVNSNAQASAGTRLPHIEPHDIIGTSNSLENERLPELPAHFDLSSYEPQMHDRSWNNRRNLGLMQPRHQLQLLGSTPGDQYDDADSKPRRELSQIDRSRQRTSVGNISRDLSAVDKNSRREDTRDEFEGREVQGELPAYPVSVVEKPKGHSLVDRSRGEFEVNRSFMAGTIRERANNSVASNVDYRNNQNIESAALPTSSGISVREDLRAGANQRGRNYSRESARVDLSGAHRLTSPRDSSRAKAVEERFSTTEKLRPGGSNWEHPQSYPGVLPVNQERSTLHKIANHTIDTYQDRSETLEEDQSRDGIEHERVQRTALQPNQRPPSKTRGESQMSPRSTQSPLPAPPGAMPPRSTQSPSPAPPGPMHPRLTQSPLPSTSGAMPPGFRIPPIPIPYSDSSAQAKCKHNTCQNQRASDSMGRSQRPSPKLEPNVTCIDPSNQMCPGGSKELNFRHGCKKDDVMECKEVDFVNSGECKPHANAICIKETNLKCEKEMIKKIKAEHKRRETEEKRKRKMEAKRKKADKAREKKEKKEREKERRRQCKKEYKRCLDAKSRMCACRKCRDAESSICIMQTDTSDCSEKPKKKRKKDRVRVEKNKKSGADCLLTKQFECPPPAAPVVSLYKCQERENKPCKHPDGTCPGSKKRERTCTREQSPYIKPNQCPQPIPIPDCSAPKQCRECCCPKMDRCCSANIYSTDLVEQQPNPTTSAPTNSSCFTPTNKCRLNSPQHYSNGSAGPPGMSNCDTAAGVAFSPEIGHGDLPDTILQSMRPPDSTSMPPGFPTDNNCWIDLTKKGGETGTNKRYVPPCVLYLDCTKVKDLCVIIKDKYDEYPS